MIFSKLLCEIIIVAGVNDQFRVTRTSPAETMTLTLTPGRYRDHVALAAEMLVRLSAAAWTAPAPAWSVTIPATHAVETTGRVFITCSESFSVSWTLMQQLRDELGFTGAEVVAPALIDPEWLAFWTALGLAAEMGPAGATAYGLTATNIHVGGWYPLEPVETDDRPRATGSDRWSNDAVQQEGRTGLLATTGGSYLTRRRSFGFLVGQDELEVFQLWLQRVGRGYSFAFYHDRDVAWPGASGECREYKARIEGDAGFSYSPDRVDPANTVWHRQTLNCAQRVAPTP